MRQSALGLAFFVCLGQVYTLHGIEDEKHFESQPLEALASLLLANSNQVAWNAPVISLPRKHAARPSSIVPARRHAGLPRMDEVIIDLEDPDIKDLWLKFQDLDESKLRKLLANEGIEIPPGWGEFEARQMYITVYMDKNKPPEKKAKYATESERLMVENPAYRALVQRYMEDKVDAKVNFLRGYVDEPEWREGHWDFDRFEYQAALKRELDEALAWKEEKIAGESGKLKFSGFPDSLDGDDIKMIFSEHGEVEEIDCKRTPQLIMEGRVKMKTQEQAQALIDNFEGQEMDAGVKLTFTVI